MLCTNYPQGHLCYTVVMREGTRKGIRGTSVMVGLIIGAGIFGVPYAFVESGVFIGTLMTAAVGAALLLYHLLYVEVILRTRERHRLPGLILRYYGRRLERSATITHVLGFWGTLLAYLIVGGNFLALMIGSRLPITHDGYTYLLFAILAASVYGGLRYVAKLEVSLVIVMLIAVAIVIIRGFTLADPAAFGSILAGRGYVTLYGVLVFAIAGASAVPEVRDVMRGGERHIARAVGGGTALAVGVIYLFTLAVLSVTGALTTPDALTGLAASVGNGMVTIGVLFGLVAVISSYLVIAVNLREVFELDFHVPRFPSWLLTNGVPAALFALGAQSFIAVIGITGAVFVGAEAVFIGLLAYRARRRGDRTPEYVAPVPDWLIFILIALFLFGAVAEVVKIL